MQKKITLLIVDDHPLVREGMKPVLERFLDLSVVATAANGEQAVAACYTLQPDVVLMDVNLPDMSGIEAMTQILSRLPDTRVLILTSYTHDLKVQEALNKGATGFLVKNAEISELVRAIHNALEGKHTLSPEAVKSLIQNRPRAASHEQDLTSREIEVLKLMVRGFTNKEIGHDLSISLATVKVYAAKIYKKFDVGSRSEAVAKAISTKIVLPD